MKNTLDISTPGNTGQHRGFALVETIDASPTAQLSPQQRTSRLRSRVESGSKARRLEAIVTVVARALEVFGTREKAIEWLRTPLPALSHKIPLSMLDTVAGLGQVEDVLGRIEHGVW